MATIQVGDSNFETIISKGTVLVDFWAAWCGPCKAIAPKLEELATEKAGQLVVAKLNVDENPASTAKYGIRSIPTLILFRDGQVANQIMGNVSKEQLISFVEN